MPSTEPPYPNPPQDNPTHRKHGNLESVKISAEFSGILPPPSLLRAYDDAIPGLGRELVEMAKEEGIHRRKMEERMVAAEFCYAQSRPREVLVGQIFALLVVLVCVGLGTLAIIRGHDTAGATIGTVGVGSIVGAFLYRRKLQANEESEAEASARDQTTLG